MTRNTFVWLIVIVAITVVLGGASLIVANNPVQAAAGAPVGFVLVAKWRVIRLAQGQNATSITTSASAITYPKWRFESAVAPPLLSTRQVNWTTLSPYFFSAASQFCTIVIGSGWSASTVTFI